MQCWGEGGRRTETSRYDVLAVAVVGSNSSYSFVSATVNIAVILGDTATVLATVIQ